MGRLRCAVLAVVMLIGVVHASPAQAGFLYEQSSTAIYHGRTIDLSVSWEGAQACWIAYDGNSCYDSEKDMDAAHGSLLRLGPGVLTSTCNSNLRVYDNTGFVAPVLALNIQGTWLQLSGWGFSARTSSYIIGVCNSTFADGGGSVYPGSTSPGSAATSMLSGWNNRVTQIYIF